MRAREIFFNKRVAQADGVENLRATIGLVGRDAHLGHNLQETLPDRLDKALLNLIGRNFILQVFRHRAERFKRQPGVDGFRAITSETCKMMHFARFTCFNNETHRRPQTLADQMMMNRRGCEQGGHWNTVWSYHTVG